MLALLNTDLVMSRRRMQICQEYNLDSKQLLDVATLFAQFVILLTVLFKVVVRLPCVAMVSKSRFESTPH